jgi:hypothetical protein
MKRIRDQLGLAGLLGIALLAAALAFSSLVVAPLQERSALLATRKGPASAQPGADKVAAVYQYLEKDEETTDWLARLHGIGAATGVRLKSASYRTQKTDARIVRTRSCCRSPAATARSATSSSARSPKSRFFPWTSSS